MRTASTVGRTDPLLPGKSHNLDVEEVRLLWSFVHGDIMDGTARRLLRQAWGLCDRHSWGHAVVEIELWQYGAGKAGGHQPFDVCVLYQDLLETMLQQLEGTRPRRLSKLLRGSGNCPICRDLAGEDGPASVLGIPVGYAGSDSESLTAEANKFTFTTRHMMTTAAKWRPAVCPECAARNSSSASVAGILCRRHLAEQSEHQAADPEGVVDWLRSLQRPLLLLTESMTQKGNDATPEAAAAWVNTLAWFHGWTLPIDLVTRSSSEHVT